VSSGSSASGSSQSAGGATGRSGGSTGSCYKPGPSSSLICADDCSGLGSHHQYSINGPAAAAHRGSAGTSDSVLPQLLSSQHAPSSVVMASTGR